MDRSPRVSMSEAAAKIEEAHFTASHPAYRQHLENQRLLSMDISLLLDEDSGRAADWHRSRTSGRGFMHWLEKFFLTLRVRAHGKHAAEAVEEAAKGVVQMSLVHGEYMKLESKSGSPASSTVGGSGRYRTEGS